MSSDIDPVDPTLPCAAIVLCGGRSTRMGQAKLALPFGSETMLGRVVRLLSTVAWPIVVVAAQDQDVPPLPAGVLIVRDLHADRGPLEGLRAGMAALPADVQRAYVTSCDVPLLVPAVVSRLVELLCDFDAAVPHTGGFFHPLSAVYRTSVLPEIESLLAADRLRVTLLLESIRTRAVRGDELTDIDPELLTLENLNQPDDYQRALARAGFAGPETTR